ncbi:MAG TPA: hypothetical protein VND45_00810, partial [Thermoanaerobaculia bacterium]|nr:hypothetical protein [Thermoanaerobaculia bacterium]
MRLATIAAALLLICFAVSASAQPTPATVANLVHEEDQAKRETALRAVITDAKPLVRAAAARVAAVRSATALLPELRAALATESDAIAAREQIRALGLL